MSGPHHVHALAGGATLVTAAMPERLSASVVLMFGGGSRLEDERLAGVSHFIEHLFFKGTRRRPSSKEIADAIEGVGGFINASTDKELTAYWTRVPAEHLLPAELDGGPSPATPPALDASRVVMRRRRTEQAHICMGVRAYSYLHPDRYVLDLLNTVLGEGMSSRLFLNIRERLGLAYDVHSFTQKHRDTGLLGVYLGVEPKKAAQAVAAVMGEMRVAREQELTDEELYRAKEFTKGRLRLELETTNGVAFWLTYQQLLMGAIKTIDEEVALVDVITAQDVRRVANDVLGGPMQLAVIGPFAKDTSFRLAIGA